MNIFLYTLLVILTIQGWVMVGWFVVNWTDNKMQVTDVIFSMIFWPVYLLLLISTWLEKRIAKL